MTRREEYEQRDAEIREEIRKQYKHDGEFRHAKEWSEILGRPLGQVQGALTRLWADGGIDQKRGRRPRHNAAGEEIGTFSVREYGPSRDDLRMTILALEASTRLALSAAGMMADPPALFTFKVAYNAPAGFEVADSRPGHRIELDSFLEEMAH